MQEVIIFARRIKNYTIYCFFRNSTFLVCTSLYEKVRDVPSSSRTVNTAGNTPVTSPLHSVDLPLPLEIFISTGMLSSCSTLFFVPDMVCPISLIELFLTIF